MKLLTESSEYDDTIEIARDLSGEYNKSCYFHCYWNGQLNEKHFFSI